MSPAATTIVVIATTTTTAEAAVMTNMVVDMIRGADMAMGMIATDLRA